MTGFAKLSLSCVAVAGGFLMLQHGRMALRADLPKDMPAQSAFMTDGFNYQRLEPRGQWVACGQDLSQATNFCRISDAKGTIVYQGDFLPLSGNGPLPTSDLKVVPASQRSMWVQGPSSAGPVPVISLQDGETLVPADERVIFASRMPDVRRN